MFYQIQLMKKLILPFIALALLLATSNADEKSKAAEPKGESKKEKVKCALNHEKDADENITTEYEGVTYSFCCKKCKAQFTKDREESLYHKIGGQAAMDAAIKLFYKKMLADEKVSHFFDDVDMKQQHKKQKAFISAALGSPKPWTGRNMRRAHRDVEISEEDFGVVAGHLQATLEELKVKKELVGEIMKIVGSTKDDVMNKKKKPAKGDAEASGKKAPETKK